MNADGAEQPADDRPENETDAEHRAQHAEALGPMLGLGDVGDIGIGDRGIGLHQTAHQTGCDQHGDRGGHCGRKKVQGQAAKAEQQHRSAPEAVGQRAQDRRAKKVGRSERKRHDAQPVSLVGRTLGETADEAWQHRHDDADRDHVDQDREHDEAHGRRAWGFVGQGGRREG